MGVIQHAAQTRSFHNHQSRVPRKERRCWKLRSSVNSQSVKHSDAWYSARAKCRNSKNIRQMQNIQICDGRLGRRFRPQILLPELPSSSPTSVSTVGQLDESKQSCRLGLLTSNGSPFRESVLAGNEANVNGRYHVYIYMCTYVHVYIYIILYNHMCKIHRS